MKILTLTQRIFIAFSIALGTALLTSPLLFLHWSMAGLALVLDGLATWSMAHWLKHYVELEHGYFLHVIRDLRASLHSGRQSQMLKSSRSEDSFGELARELNGVIEEVASQVSRQLEENRHLEQNKTLFQSILGTMIEAVLVLDADRRVLYFNEAARRVLRSQERNVEGRPVWEVLRSPELNEAIESVYDSGREFRKEIQLSRSKSVLEVTAVPLSLKPQPGVVVVLHEVTELRSLERMRREFVSNVSHELKTPLTSIQVYAETLLDGGLADETHNRQFVERILEQSDRLQGLIQDMLRLARIESQSEAFELRAVGLSKTLETCVDARLAVARSKEIELKLHPGPRGVAILADASGLQTIFDNLISNSLHYTPAGGQVDVRWFVEEDQAVIEVSDNGIGIGPEHLERIFERFYRVDKSRSQSVGGTGLGLAIVKHLISVFHGKIDVASTPGQGSRFRVILPIQSRTELPASAEDPIAE